MPDPFYNRFPPQRQQPMYVRRRRRKPRWRFRWGWLGILGLILGAMWLAAGLTPSFSWRSVIRAVGVRHVELFTMLATLGVLGVALCLVIRVLRPKDEDEDS